MKRLDTLLEENYLPLRAIWRAESERQANPVIQTEAAIAPNASM
jgi:hypothetical protein